MRRRLGPLALAGAALLVLAASAGAGPAARKNGRILFAAEKSDQSRLVTLDLRSKRLRRIEQADGTDWPGPAISSDGRFVAFTLQDPSSGDRRIWVARLDGKGRRHVVAFGSSPSWSPDGRRLVFTTCPTYDHCAVVTVGRGGHHRRTIYSGPVASPRWAPKGKWIAFLRKTADPQAWDLFVVHADGSRAHRAVSVGDAYEAYDWSPTGDQLVFVGKDSQLHLVSASGGPPRQLTHDALRKGRPRWSPNGKLIACYVSTPTGLPLGLVVMDVAGRTLHRFADSGGHSWSPHGRRLAYFTRDGIEIAKPTGSGRRLILRRAIGINYFNLEWMPNGRELVTTREAFDIRSALFSIRPNGTRLRRLTPAHRPAIDPAVSPGGRLIAFARVREAGNRDLALMRSDGAHVRLLTRNRYGWDFEPSWSPDGRKIAFVRWAEWGKGNLKILNLADRSLRTVKVARPRHPSWSPDGRSIAVDGVRNTDTRGIRIVDPETGQVREETHPGCGWDSSAQWSPDASRLLYLRLVLCGSGFWVSVRVRTLQGGDEKIIPGSGPFYGTLLAASWAPDGQHIAVGGILNGTYSDDPQLAKISPDGSTVETIWTGHRYPTGVSWAARPRK